MLTLSCLAPVRESTISFAITASLLKFVGKKLRNAVNISQIEKFPLLNVDPTLIAVSI